MAEIHLLLHLIAAAADASASEHISEARGQARMKADSSFHQVCTAQYTAIYVMRE